MKYFPCILLLALIAVGGCKAGSKSAHDAAANGRNSRADTNADASSFDYYVFHLAWMPNFCQTHGDSSECASRPGFVVQGLWPQKNDGRQVENCYNPATASNPSAYHDLIPDSSLLSAMWTVHGSCSGMGADSYFSNVEAALKLIEIPSTFAAAHNPPAKIEPGMLLEQLHSDNPGFPAASFAVSCNNNMLTAVEVCFDKTLSPIACKGIESCSSKTIDIPTAQ